MDVEGKAADANSQVPRRRRHIDMLLDADSQVRVRQREHEHMQEMTEELKLRRFSSRALVYLHPLNTSPHAT